MRKTSSELKSEMKVLGVIVLILVVLIVSVIFAVDHSPSRYVPSPEIKPGQVWIYKNDNPFKDETAKYLVLEVRGEWVKYVNVKYIHKNGTDFSHTDRTSSFTDFTRLQVDNLE